MPTVATCPKAREIQAILRAPGLRRPAAIQTAFAAIVPGQIRLIEALNAQVAALGEVVTEHLGVTRTLTCTPANNLGSASSE